MTRILYVIFWMLSFLPLSASEGSVAGLVVFWNLENFFDYTDGGENGSDREFSAAGDRRWTKSRYWKKCHGIAKTLLWIADRYGRMPDVAGVAEVENRTVMQSVIKGTLLRKYDYVQVHHDSPDPRGIDVALIYRQSVFVKISDKAYHVTRDAEGNPMTTRDILYVCLERKTGEPERKSDDGGRYHFLVNHHPSKFGGERLSEKKRTAAMRKMMEICDSLLSAGEKNIVCMGDFNDTPDGAAFPIIGNRLVNLAEPLAERGKGTIRYAGKWDLIDMFIVSPDVAGSAAMEICFPEFLAVEDGTYSGYKPLRTYTGPRYAGGISDHLPIVMVASGQ